MSYRRAFSTLGCPALSLDEALALAGRYDLDAIELRALGGTIDLTSYLEIHFKTPTGLAERLRSSPVKVAALDTSFKLIGHTTDDREALIQFLPWAEAIGVTHLRVFDGGNDGGINDITAAADAITWWREIRARNCWKADLMVETHDAFVSAEALLRFIAAAPGVAILWDSHHTWKKGGENPLATWKALKSHIVHIHVKDSISRPSGKHPFTYVLPGEGEFPAAPLLSMLRAEFDGIVSLEWEKMWHPQLAPIEDALSAAAKSRWW